MNSKNKTILVTGSSRGIGEAVATLAHEQGYQVILHGKSKSQKLLDIQKKLSGSKIVAFDVANTDEVNEAINGLGTIDVLVNNAGTYHPASFEELTEGMWDDMLDVNLKGVFNCIKAVYPQMKSRKQGKIINISSIVAFVGSLSSASYSVSKAGVSNLTKTLSKEFGPFGVTINSVAPGPVQTDLLNQLDQSVIDKMSKEIPLGRVAQPKDIAEVVLFFVSSGADYITGQTLVVDGGRI